MRTFSRNLVHSSGASAKMAATWVAGVAVAVAADAAAAGVAFVTIESIAFHRRHLAFDAVAMV